MTLLDRLTAEGPKRILALDGGGIRGALTLGYLERIEGILRRRHQSEDLRLCQYFDLIGGTSTGAIIAAALAIGLSASEIKKMYLDLGGKVFGRKKLKVWDARFDEKPLIEELAKVFGERRLGDDSVLTGLCIVTKRADTASTWPLINHPRGKYYEKNGPIPLREAVRASTAAPTYFVPQKLMVGGEEWGAFVDGGVSMANNPALQLFLVATLKGFPFRWAVGEDRLMLVSVGTGFWTHGKAVEDVTDDKLWDWAAQVPELLMEDANWQNQLLLQYLSRTATPWEIDREVGDLSTDLLTSVPALTYLRYNVRIEGPALSALGLDDLAAKAEKLREMSDADNRNDLAHIGDAAARQQVRDEHFPDAFNLPAGGS
jgi:patatin-like phospholipase/acyl hydrolase